MLTNYKEVSVSGENLKDAIEKESQEDRYGCNSVMAKWYEDELKNRLEDEEYEEEYRPSDMWRIGIEIGNKSRKIWIGKVHAKDEKDALKPTNAEVQDISAEFIGFKYKLIAEHIPRDEFMTREKYEQMIMERGYDYNPFDMLSKAEQEDDKSVAELFGLTGEIDYYELDCSDKLYPNRVNPKAVIGRCGYCNCVSVKENLFCYNEQLKQSLTEGIAEDEVGLCPECGAFLCSEHLFDEDVKLLVRL